MKSRQEQNLEIIDNIDEDIINRNTEKRAALMQVFTLAKRRRTEKRIIIGSAAGLVAASILLMILIPMFSLFSKQVPIYKGMSVSGVGESLIQNSDGVREITQEMPVFLSSVDESTDTPVNPAAPDGANKSEKPLWDPNAIGETYFAAPGEDILITVHIDNPDEFEILSFTLNGEKFTAYMFEEGSDLEHLVLKVNVGEVEGYHEYTIDAIKYADTDDTIKSVIMDGERTIKVGVAAGKNKPIASISDIEIGYDYASFDVSIPDTLGLIKDGGEVRATLYLGSKVTASKLLESLSEAVTFNRLKVNKEYRIIITASYDALDGEGVKEHVLAEQNISTACPFTFHLIADAPPGRYFDLYGGISTTDASIIMNGGKLTHDGVTASVDDLAHFPVPSGDSILTLDFRIGSKHFTAEMQIDTTIPYEDLKGYYTIVETHTPEVGEDEEEIPPSAIDLIPSCSDDMIVYALEDGTINELRGDVVIGCKQDDGTTLLMRYESIKARRDLKVGQKIRKGEVIGCFYTTRLSPNNACIEGKYVHFLVQAGDSFYFYDPRVFIP